MIRFELENYFPEAHYRRAVDKAFRKEAEDELLPDGGRTQYYWSGEEGVVYHTETENEMVDPFFGSISEAERYLENLADRHGKEQYTSLVLRKSGNRKVEEATDVLTEQSGLGDFATDGGRRLYKIAEQAEHLKW
ncbi:hypothetical protein [Haloarcula marismortui]|uniref:Uncharacterized protein n=1 Tax=Haloarcula marismortui ATCC 33800 TaxID=662476 RepID=M0K5V0_9EURY|nr:hypothetical protein [Haloarcula sinaiiensis]EMA15200.1 hypothetical protein C436_05450 [Haloarcula sinaiiensis ATCC 33800]QUJ71945.1 hypothetical protein KDQ40_14825 [Haloarcula sinaiiensis ATCC 33800]